jgi:hypothetical protein
MGIDGHGLRGGGMPLWDLGIRLLLGVGLLFAAGTASAQVVEGDFLIVDDRNSLIEAFVSSVGDENFVQVDAACGSGDDSVLFDADTNHPDDVRINQNKADVRQRNRNNANSVLISGFSGAELQFAGIVSGCRSTKVEASVNTRRSPSTGNFRVDVRECSTTLSATDVAFIEATCASTREINGSYNPSTGDVRRLRINGRGEAVDQGRE